MQRRVALDVGPAHGVKRPAGDKGEEQLQNGVVAAEAGLHDGVAAADVAAQDAAAVGLAEEMHDLGVALARGEHQGCLVVVVEGRAGVLVAGGEEHLADVPVAERRRQVEVRVGEVRRGGVWAVEEGGMRFQNSAEEGSVVGVDCASDTNRWLNPMLFVRSATLSSPRRCWGLHFGQSVMVDKRAQHEAYREREDTIAKEEKEEGGKRKVYLLMLESQAQLV